MTQRKSVCERGSPIESKHNAMDVSDDDTDCSMIIIDGVVMGPQVTKLTWPSRNWIVTFFKHCVAEVSIDNLQNTRGAAFCEHES